MERPATQPSPRSPPPQRAGRGFCAAVAVAQGYRVLVLCGKTLDWHPLLLGVLKAGSVAIPCSDMLRGRDLAFRARHSGARLLVCERSAEAKSRSCVRNWRRRPTCSSSTKPVRGSSPSRMAPRRRTRRRRIRPSSSTRRARPRIRKASSTPTATASQSARRPPLARRAPGRPRLVHRRHGLGEVDLERPARPLEPGRSDRPPRGRFRRS